MKRGGPRLESSEPNILCSQKSFARTGLGSKPRGASLLDQRVETAEAPETHSPREYRGKLYRQRVYLVHHATGGRLYTGGPVGIDQQHLARRQDHASNILRLSCGSCELPPSEQSQTSGCHSQKYTYPRQSSLHLRLWFRLRLVESNSRRHPSLQHTCEPRLYGA